MSLTEGHTPRLALAECSDRAEIPAAASTHRQLLTSAGCRCPVASANVTKNKTNCILELELLHYLPEHRKLDRKTFQGKL